MMFQLFTDTDTDITPAVAKEYGYELISMPYVIGEQTTYPYVDFEEFDSKKFYDVLRGGVLPSTAGLSPARYMEYFEPYFAQGKDILYVHFSRAMSSTFNSMDIALKELAQKYPDRKCYTIDTKAITILSYNIVREIGELAKQGKSAQEIVDWANANVDNFAVYFFADDLKFFAKSGRVSGVAAFMGGLLGIRPIIHINNEGKMVSIAKARGQKVATQKLLEYVRTLKGDIKSHRVIIGHSDAIELAQDIEKQLKAEYGDDLNTEIVVVNPTAGSHCGPNTVGVSFHAINR
jgi:DegV family protein with EDD domain